MYVTIFAVTPVMNLVFLHRIIPFNIIFLILDDRTEPVFVNVYGGQESIPRNRFRQPM